MWRQMLFFVEIIVFLLSETLVISLSKAVVYLPDETVYTSQVDSYELNM